MASHLRTKWRKDDGRYLAFAVRDVSLQMKERPVNLPLPHPPAPSELTVVGEHRSDPMRLLVLGVDGRYYAYSLLDGEPEPVEPDDEWEIEQPAPRPWARAS